MDDTFFGFNTSLPCEDNGSGEQIAEPSEEEYDALNDETFGSATNGDWEAAHETLVRLTDCVASTKASPPKSDLFLTGQVDKSIDSDLELNLSEMKLDDTYLDFDDDEIVVGSSGMHLAPNVWASSPTKSIRDQPRNSIEFNCRTTGFQGAQASNRFHQHIQDQKPTQLSEFEGAQQNFPGTSYGICDNLKPRFCTLEDIERNIIVGQTMRKQLEQQSTNYSQEAQKNCAQINSSLKHVLKTHTVHNLEHQQISPHQQNLQKQSQFSQYKGQPVKLSNSSNHLAQHPLGNFLQQQTCSSNRFLPGFNVYHTGLSAALPQQNNNHISQHTLLNQHGLQVNVQQLSQRALPSSHLPIALNNFAMHPNFNAMRAPATTSGIQQAAVIQPQQPARIHPHTASPAILLNAQQSNTMYNMFNMRLVQEIQQNHPLLQNTARQVQHAHQFGGINTSQRLAQHHQRTNNIAGNKTNNQREGYSNGNLPNANYDEYANLMSTRDKHWLIGIQLSQLNTDTPYIDDFYYTVYRERALVKNGNQRHSQAHKDNQLNHPLTQPKGHAQLILVQLGSKNGTRNGQHTERQNSDSSVMLGNNIGSVGNNDHKMPYVFTPLKFENSLGKLQYGSVTAPRKIIDAEIMGKETVSTATSNSNNTNFAPLRSNTVINPATSITSDTLSIQRKSRHILLQIETLYRIVLKLEDLNNPIAISTIILKKKKEHERISALEQLENVNKSKEDRTTDSASQYRMNIVLKSKFTYEIEKREILMAKLMASLSYEEVPAIMNVRKGKTLIRRIMPFIEDHEVRWNIWVGIFASLQNVLKRDKDDADGVLFALYPEFKKQIHQADFETIVRVSASMDLNDKKYSGVFCSKFGISSLVCLVLRAEYIYTSGKDITHTDSNKDNWRNFLNKVASLLNRTIQSHTISAEIESDSIQPLMNHFARFQDLKLDSLLELITEAKHQIT